MSDEKIMNSDIMISSESIQSRIKELGKQITEDYKGKKIVVIGVLTGAYVFCADLLREIKVPVELLEFVSVSSYGDSTESSGNVRMYLDLKRDIKDKHILIIEDIVDTGLTLHSLMEIFERRHPASIKLASLLHKPAKSKHKIDIDYLGFTIEDKFVYGYGLDLFGTARELPHIAIYNGEPKK